MKSGISYYYILSFFDLILLINNTAKITCKGKVCTYFQAYINNKLKTYPYFILKKMLSSDNSIIDTIVLN